MMLRAGLLALVSCSAIFLATACDDSEVVSDNGAADATGEDTAMPDPGPGDQGAGQDVFTAVSADADTCNLIVTPADMNDYLKSDLTVGKTWVWLASVQETGAYDAQTSTQHYAVCAEVFRCESGSWGQLEIMIFQADQAPSWLTGVRGVATQLVGVGDEAWEYPLQTAVVVWVGDYIMYLGARSGFTKSWTQDEIDAYARVVVDVWTRI